MFTIGPMHAVILTTEGVLETVGFKKTTEYDEQARMPEGSEFHTDGTMTLKPWEAKVVWT